VPYLLSFFFGACIGSFVQVVATRLNVAPIIRSRSKCLSCGEALRASDLIPVLSYLTHRGKCAYCKTPYGISALIIESLFGGVFVLLLQFILTGLGLVSVLFWFIYYTVLFTSLGVIALYDYRHNYIPATFLLIFSVLSFIMLGIRYSHSPTFGTLLGALVVGLPFLLIWLLSKGKALGFGDVILFCAIGAFFGVEQGLAVLLLSIWTGAIVGIVMYMRRGMRFGSSTAIPFVPFIVIAFLFVLFTDTDIFSIASLFS
jgi:leader peptidase (prepilin peptidase)/N-methyltransferase